MSLRATRGQVPEQKSCQHRRTSDTQGLGSGSGSVAAVLSEVIEGQKHT